MRTVETLMAPGAFEIVLRGGAGISERQQIVESIGTYNATTDRWTPTLDGYIAVFDTPTLSPSFARASYVGKLLDIAGANRFVGEGLGCLLNQTDGIGVVATTTVEYTSATLSTWISRLFPVNGISVGSVSNVGLSSAAGVWTVGQGLREFLHVVCSDVGGAEWRINPDLTIDAGLPGSMFRDSEVLFTPSPSSTVGTPRGVAGTVSGFSVAGSGTAGRVLVAGAGEGAQMVATTVTAAGTLSYDPVGNGQDRTFVVDSPSSDAAQAALIAARQSDLREVAGDHYSVSVGDPHVRWWVSPGDTVLVYDPDRFVSGGDALDTGEGVVYPQRKRVFTVSGPVPASSSVWLYRSSVDRWVDLTLALDWSVTGGETVVEVGSPVGPADIASAGSPAWLGSPVSPVSVVAPTVDSPVPAGDSDGGIMHVSGGGMW